ncbi:AAA domain-containing protein [Miniphocaeibacter massiliensis]|uniref:AAA domain-containing protein n=1 Tax=Miniphocaeibacter massiliensis TaxID=2041841 RepID=UPI000C07C2FF|nr:AAA domain-containing protein [Miniphocaeibacter massiliensis]
MNEKKFLILCKGEDKTKQVSDFDIIKSDEKYKIKFNSGKIYYYNKENIKFFENPREVKLENSIIYYKSNLIDNVDIVINFKDKFNSYYKLIRKDNNNILGLEEDFSIIKNVSNQNIKNIMYYLRCIVDMKKDKVNEINFLSNQYKKLEFIHPESVLSNYLNKDDIISRNLSCDDTIFPFNFNINQRKAVKNALTYNISVIEGPPGTGKTQTILNIIANLVTIHNKSIGIVSNNNSAVENVLDKMTKKGYGFLLADLGREEKRKKFFQNMSLPIIDNWNYKKDIRELQNEINEINKKLRKLLKIKNKLAKLEEQLEAYKLEKEHFGKYYREQNIKKNDEYPFNANKSDKIIKYLSYVSIFDNYELKKSLINRIEIYFKKKIYKLDNNDIDKILNFQNKFYILKIDEVEKEIKEISSYLKFEEFEDLMAKQQNTSEKLFRQKLYESHGKLRKMDFSLNNYKNKFRDFIKYYPVILSTNHSIKNSLPKNYLLDYIIIDESSQVDLVTAMLTLSSCKNIIIVGDDKQLSHIVDKDIMKEKKKLDIIFERLNIPKEYNYFEKNIMSSIAEIYKGKIETVTLKEHYRCHPKIINFCNQKYYDGELIVLKKPTKEVSPLMVYETTEGNHMRKLEGKGRYNQRELDVIKREVLDSVNVSKEDIGHATPYRLQADKAKQYFPLYIQNDTIHKFQGREKKVIIMSTVLDSYEKINFIDDPRLINVAVSRAEEKFILVTNPILFQKEGSNIQDLIGYIKYNTLNEGIIKSDIVSVFDLLYKEYSKKLESFKKRIIVKSRYDSENIIYTLLNDIFSNEIEGIKDILYNRYKIATQIFLKNILKSDKRLNIKESNFINNKSSVDFVIYNKFDNRIKCAIEVDGFSFHENNKKQLERDKLKDGILDKYSIPLLRLKTNESDIKNKIQNFLKKYL